MTPVRGDDGDMQLEPRCWASGCMPTVRRRVSLHFWGSVAGNMCEGTSGNEVGIDQLFGASGLHHRGPRWPKLGSMVTQVSHACLRMCPGLDWLQVSQLSCKLTKVYLRILSLYVVRPDWLMQSAS